MLYCFRAVFNRVAYTLFANCTHVNYVVDPRQSFTSQEMHYLFWHFLYIVSKYGILIQSLPVKKLMLQRIGVSLAIIEKKQERKSTTHISI